MICSFLYGFVFLSILEDLFGLFSVWAVTLANHEHCLRLDELVHLSFDLLL